MTTWTSTETPPDPPDDGGYVDTWVSALTIWAGTWRNGAWREDTSDLMQGDASGRGMNYGAAFFGPYLASIGTLTALSIRISRLAAAGSPLTAVTPAMRLLAGQQYQDSYPTVLATAAGPPLLPNDTLDWGVPSSWVPQLQDGTAGGIGIGSSTAGTPYLVLDGDLQLLVNITTAPYGGFGVGSFGTTPFGGALAA